MKFLYNDSTDQKPQYLFTSFTSKKSEEMSKIVAEIIQRNNMDHSVYNVLVSYDYRYERLSKQIDDEIK